MMSGVSINTDVFDDFQFSPGLDSDFFFLVDEICKEKKFRAFTD